MTLNDGAKPFPIIYYDGESEINLGVLKVDPTMHIKTLLSILSHKIGISPHQFFVFIADQRSHRKIPLTAKLNLAGIISGGEYYFYVKRSKKSPKKNQSEKHMFLRRESFRPGFSVAASVLRRVEIERMMWNLKMEREAFFMSMRNKETRNGGGSGGESGGAVCKECLMARLRGTDADFHLCVNDKVVFGFRSSAGPISRPV